MKKKKQYYFVFYWHWNFLVGASLLTQQKGNESSFVCEVIKTKSASVLAFWHATWPTSPVDLVFAQGCLGSLSLFLKKKKKPRNDTLLPGCARPSLFITYT